MPVSLRMRARDARNGAERVVVFVLLRNWRAPVLDASIKRDVETRSLQ